jgi:uncharacterized membrane protein
VADSDQFCQKCGTRQAVSTGAGPAPSGDLLSGISGRTASLLCYIPLAGWIAAIVVLASSRFRHDAQVRFNAFQGLYLFVAWLVVDIALAPLFMLSFIPGFGLHRLLPGLMKVVIFATWIYMMVKISQQEQVHLPVLGELAERSVAEQR